MGSLVDNIANIIQPQDAKPSNLNTTNLPSVKTKEHLSVVRNNQIIHCVLNSHLANVLSNEEVFYQYSTRCFKRQGRGCVYIQHASVEDAVSVSGTPMIMGLSLEQVQRIPGSEPIEEMMKKYNPGKEFVCVIGIPVDNDNRGWYVSGIISPGNSGIFKYPDFSSDEFVNYNPMYVKDYETSKDVEKFKQSLEKEKAYLDYCQRTASEFRSLVPLKKFQDIDEFIANCITEKTCHEKTKITKADYILLQQKISTQKFLASCNIQHCDKVEFKPGYFEENACNYCKICVYCSNECRKKDWGIHRKECYRVKEFSRHFSKKKKSINQQTHIEF